LTAKNLGRATASPLPSVPTPLPVNQMESNQNSFKLNRICFQPNRPLLIDSGIQGAAEKWTPKVFCCLLSNRFEF